MATFVNVYISSFIRTASPQKLLALVIAEIMKLEQNPYFNSALLLGL
jgi:hypothetical protein